MSENPTYETMDKPKEEFKPPEPSSNIETGNIYEEIQTGSYERDSATRTDAERLTFRADDESGPLSPAERRMYGKSMSRVRNYDGLTDPKVWLIEYETVNIGNLWDQQMLHLRLIDHLEGAAREWYLNQKKRKRNLDWVLVKQELINRFANSCDDLMRYEKINRIRQGKQNFVAYWETKEAEILNICPEMDDQEIITHMINGLNEGLKRDSLRALAGKNLITLESVRTQIKRLSEIREYFSEIPEKKVRFRSNAYVSDNLNEYRQQNPNYKPWTDRPTWNRERKSQNDEQVEAIKELTRKMNELLSNASKRQVETQPKGQNIEPTPVPRRGVKRETSKPNKQIICYTCNEPGHVSTQCSTKEREMVRLNARETITRDEIRRELRRYL